MVQVYGTSSGATPPRIKLFEFVTAPPTEGVGGLLLGAAAATEARACDVEGARGTCSWLPVASRCACPAHLRLPSVCMLEPPGGEVWTRRLPSGCPAHLRLRSVWTWSLRARMLLLADDLSKEVGVVD